VVGFSSQALEWPPHKLLGSKTLGFELEGKGERDEGLGFVFVLSEMKCEGVLGVVLLPSHPRGDQGVWVKFLEWLTHSIGFRGSRVHLGLTILMTRVHEVK